MATWSCSSRFANSRRLEISALADVGSPMAAKAMLRHANLATTTAHYIKFVHAAAIREMDKISSLFDNESSFGHPNRSEERRVGKEWSYRCMTYQKKRKDTKGI